MPWTAILIHFALPCIASVGFFYAAALMVWPAIQTGHRSARLIIFALALAFAVFAELLLRPEPKIVRGGVSVLALLLALRAYSYCQSSVRGSFLRYIRFLSIGLLNPHLIYSPSGHHAPRSMAIGKEMARFAGGVLVAIVACALAKRLLLTQPAIHSWIVNDLILTCGFVILMQAYGQSSFALWKLLGIQSHPLVDHILLSRTPAEFWRRWSWPIHLWLYRYVYIPAGGNPHRLRATLAVFVMSSLQHEYLAFSAIGRVTGHQTLFFMLNGLGVLASPAMKRFARRGIVAQAFTRLLTILFLATTASLMFTTFNYIFPIYHKKIWLMW